MMKKKIVYFQDEYIGAAKPFRLVKVRRYSKPEFLAHTIFSNLKSAFVSFTSPGDHTLYLTEIIDKNDLRAHSREVMEQKKRETRHLLDQRTFKVILRVEISQDGNVLPGRFVITIESTKDRELKHKARYAIVGHRDRLKYMMVDSATTL